MSWIRTYTGKRFDPYDLTTAVFCIEDIAHGLSNLCRFNGACSSFYSVAQHSVYVAEVLRALGMDRKAQLAALLHDASEAYLSDVPRPLKMHQSFEFYRIIEELVQGAVHTHFLGGYYLPQEVEDAIALADMAVLAAEARDLMGDPQDWDLKVPPWKGLPKVKPAPPEEAKLMFFARFAELNQKHPENYSIGHGG